MACACVAVPTFAESNPDKSEPAEKKGAAIITIYSDVHSGFGHANDDRGFGLDRAYLGYQERADYVEAERMDAERRIDQYHTVQAAGRFLGQALCDEVFSGRI